MPGTARKVRLLASVTDPHEARLVLENGADLVDAKNPREGALGALPPSVVSGIVEAVSGRRPVSATIGDLPADPLAVTEAIRRIAAAGVDIVKIGLFPGGDPQAVIAAAGAMDLGGCRLVAVLLADRGADLGCLPLLARHGFAGAMLDTADKAAGALPDVLSLRVLRDFIDGAHDVGLLAGLAGSLRLKHVATLKALAPDLLGFRGALCEGADRTSALDPRAIQLVREAVGGPDAPADSLRFEHRASAP